MYLYHSFLVLLIVYNHSPSPISPFAIITRPIGVIVDIDGILTIADSGNNAIRRVVLNTPKNREISNSKYPYGLASTVLVEDPDTDGDGMVYDFAELKTVRNMYVVFD